MLNIGPPAGNIANANANADANQEICLVDETLETAAVLELTLSLEDCIHLHMVHESQWPSWERLTRALFLAGKYEFEVAYALALSYLLLVLQRHSSSRPQRLVDLFALAITHDDERAAAFAAGGLLREAAGHSHPIAMYTTPASQLPGPAGTYWTALHKAYAQFPRNYIWCSQCTPGAKTHHAQCLRDKNGPVLTGDMSPSAAFLAYLQAERSKCSIPHPSSRLTGAETRR